MDVNQMIGELEKCQTKLRATRWVRDERGLMQSRDLDEVVSKLDEVHRAVAQHADKMFKHLNRLPEDDVLAAADLATRWVCHICGHSNHASSTICEKTKFHAAIEQEG